MSQEYKITKVSEQPPKEWQGEFGTVYYHKVMLDGHNKPVTIGTKSNQPPQVGETVYGDIQTSDYPEDKFKKANKFGAGGVDNSKIEQKLDAIYGELKLANASLRRLEKRETEDKVAEVDPDEDITVGDFPENDDDKIDLSAIPF